MLFSESTFQYLFKKYYAPLRSYASRFIVDADENNDVVQEVFVAFWNGEKDFPNEKAVKTYLFYSVRNKCLNLLRKDRKKSLDDLSLELPSVEEGIIEEDVFQRIQFALNHLSEQERLVMIRTMDGLSNNEIAEDIAVSINTIKTVKKRAYQKLREQLKGIEWVLVLFG